MILAESPKITYEILYSKEYNFYYDEKYHPGRGKEIAMRGWRTVARASAAGFEGVYDCCLGLNKQATEETAKEFALIQLQAKYYNHRALEENRRLTNANKTKKSAIVNCLKV